MSTLTLSDTQWSNIVSFLKTCPDIYTGQQTDLKRFIDAVVWITRSGSQWRLLPNQYGNWNSVYKRFARWCDKDVGKHRWCRGLHLWALASCRFCLLRRGASVVEMQKAGAVEVATDAGALCQSRARRTGSGRKVLLWEGEVIPMQWLNKYHRGFNRLWLVFSCFPFFIFLLQFLLSGDYKAK